MEIEMSNASPNAKKRVSFADINFFKKKNNNEQDENSKFNLDKKVNDKDDKLPNNDLKKGGASSSQLSVRTGEEDKKPGFSYKFQILLYMIFLFLHSIKVYIIRPLGTILQIVLLTTIANVKANELSETASNLISGGIKIIGWIIIFILPLYHFFATGLKIISIQDSFFSRIFSIIFLLVEITLNLPLTFLYENNLYSIFLFEERGVEQLLSPWLIFFPTDYIKSVFEIIRHFIDPIFFFGIGYYKYSEIKSNNYEAYLIILLQLMLVFCIFRIIGNFVIMILRIKYGTSVTQGNKKWKKK